jgi:hypothetical protein
MNVRIKKKPDLLKGELNEMRAALIGIYNDVYIVMGQLKKQLKIMGFEIDNRTLEAGRNKLLGISTFQEYEKLSNIFISECRSKIKELKALCHSQIDRYLFDKLEERYEFFCDVDRDDRLTYQQWMRLTPESISKMAGGNWEDWDYGYKLVPDEQKKYPSVRSVMSALDIKEASKKAFSPRSNAFSPSFLSRRVLLVVEEKKVDASSTNISSSSSGPINEEENKHLLRRSMQK